MKQTASALVALALGVGFAAAAQAQGTNTQNATPAPNSNLQSTAPAQNTQNQQSADTQRQPQIKKHRLSNHAMSQRQEIRQIQQRLKAAGLLKGRATGNMDRPTRIALLRFERQNGLPRTTNLVLLKRMIGPEMAASGSSSPPLRTAHRGKQHQTGVAHATSNMPKSQTTGVGSSMPNAKNTPVNSSGTNPAPAGAGGTASTAPSTTSPSTTTPTTPSTGTGR